VAQGFSNTMCLVMLVFLAPTAMQQSTNKERVFICVGIFLMGSAVANMMRRRDKIGCCSLMCQFLDAWTYVWPY